MKFKFKKVAALITAGVVALSLAGCNSANKADAKNKQLVVGATNVPHAEILEHVKPILAKEGIDLKIEKFQDYVLPNKALATKELDANYYQSLPFFNVQIKQFGYKFENAGGIHIEPIGVYSKKYKSLKQLPDKATIIMSNSVSDHGRMLSLLQQEGLIKLKPGIDTTTARIKDIVSNPKHLQFQASVDASLLSKVYKNGEGDAVLINTNYAIDAGLNPLKDAIALEGKNSQYVNIVAVRKGDKNKPEIKALVNALHSKQIQDWIIKKYKGAVVPVN
jgi:D-methionine transport system substrate-binding protein